MYILYSENMRHMKDAKSSIVKENGEEWKMHVRFPDDGIPPSSAARARGFRLQKPGHIASHSGQSRSYCMT